jgi:hypothetical protein
MHRRLVDAMDLSHTHLPLEGRHHGNMKLTIISTTSIKVGTFMAGHNTGSQAISSAAFARNITVFY